MIKKFFLMFVLISFFNVYADEGEVPAGEQESSEQNRGTYESAHTDELLDLVKDEELRAPEIKPPSKLMVLLRTFGIAVLSKYYALKGWISKKWSDKAPHENV